MKTLWTALGVLGFLSGAAFLVFGVLHETGSFSDERMVHSGGVTALITGVFSLREAADRDKWRRSDARYGRLTLFACGLCFCAGGMAFLGYGWLTDRIVPGRVFFGTFVASFVLALVGAQFEERRYQASRTAIRRRGWLLASRRADEDLSADEVHRAENARETLRQSIQRRLTGRITREWVEAQFPYLAASGRELAVPTDSPEIADEWRAFWSAATESDELWGFNTVSARGGRDCGEEGFALLRDGTAVDWFITAVVG